MKTKQNILEELERIQNLFEHKRGVVLSEQNPLGFKGSQYNELKSKSPKIFEGTAFDCLKDWSYLKNEKHVIEFGDKDKKDFLIRWEAGGYWSFGASGGFSSSEDGNGTWSCNRPPKLIGFTVKTEDGMIFDSISNKWNEDLSGIELPDETKTQPPQTAPKQKPTEKPAEKTSSKTTQTEKPKSPNTISGKIEMEDDKCKPGKKYKWKEVRRDYQLQKRPSTPEGSPETNTQLWKDWKSGWRPDCNKKSSISLPSAETDKLEPKVAGVTPVSQADQSGGVQPQAKLITPDLPNTSQIQASVNQNQTGQQIYKILYDGKRVSGDPEGGGRIRIDQTGMNPEQVEKLKSYMPELGYEYFRTRSRDNRLVFTPIRQEEQ